jgi:hypothetical protein
MHSNLIHAKKLKLIFKTGNGNGAMPLKRILPSGSDSKQGKWPAQVHQPWKAFVRISGVHSLYMYTYTNLG